MAAKISDVIGMLERGMTEGALLDAKKGLTEY